jgi:Spy/CpxP family protein refolding chaperone
MLQERKNVRDERDQLAQLLMAQPPDKQKIQDTILTIANLQGKIQQAVVEQILAETAAMPPEQRRLYLANIQGRMCQGQCGRGPRFGGRRGRMNRPCP